jgi:hypothetical protein
MRRSLDAPDNRPRNTATRERLAINRGVDQRHFPDRYRK